MLIIKKVKSQIIEISLGANNPQGKKENQNWMSHMSERGELYFYISLIRICFYILDTLRQ